MNTKLMSTLRVTNCCPIELSTILKLMTIEEKLVLSNGRFLDRETYRQFCAILLYITKKIRYNFHR